MSEPQGSLIYLMRFLEGHLSASEGAAARQQLSQPGWQAAWERLQLAAAETTLPVATWEEPAVAAETLAAFLEGNLSLDEAAHVEQHCWNEPELLRELISTYRFLYGHARHQDAVADLPSQPATDRLLALVTGANGASPARKPLRVTPPEIEITADPNEARGRAIFATERPAARVPVIIPAENGSTRGRRQRTPVWLAYVATIVIGLGLGIGAVVLISLSRDRHVESLQDIVTPDDGGGPIPRPEVTLPTRPGPNQPDVQPAPTSEPPTTPQPQPQPQPPVRPTDLVNETPEPDLPQPLPDPPQRPSPTAAANQTPVQQYPPLVVNWEKIDGLLVARDNDQQPWHGPNADVHRNTSATYATLPDSWASAQTNHGRVVLAEDTQVRLDRTRDTIQVDVQRGRVAISEIPKSGNVRLQVGPKSWIIQPMEEDTALGCTVFARQSHLIVQRGRVSIGGTEIAAGRQVSLGDDSLNTSSPIGTNISWFLRPERSLKVPAATRDALLASRNVRADLAGIWRKNDHPARFLAARWSLAIGDQTLAQALSSRNVKLRLLALDWLLTCQPDDPRVHLALRTLARTTGDAQTARNVLSWLRSARTKSRVTRADADRMVAGLRSNHLAIRQISAYFLEAAFGKRVAFDPTAGPQARQKAAREWTAFLDRVDRLDRVNRKH